MRHTWLVMLVMALGIHSARADEERTVDYAFDGGIKVSYKITGWCVLWGLKNTNSYKVSVAFEWDTIGSKGDVHHASVSDVQLKPGQYKGGGHFLGEPGLDDCPWVGEGQKPTTFKNFHMTVTNLDAKETAQRQEDDVRKAAEEQRRQEEEQRRKEEEQKRKDEEEKKRQEDQRRADEERRKREEAQRQDDVRRQQAADKERRTKDAAARSQNSSGGGVLTPEQLREQKRQQDIALGFQRLRDAQETNKKLGDASAGAAGAVFAIEGGNEATEMTTRMTRLLFAFGGRFLPVITNTTGATVVNESNNSGAGGLAVDGGAELWPRYLQRWGIGVGGEVGVAGMAVPGGGMYALHAGLGAKGYYGNDARWSAIGELGVFGELVGSSGLFIDAHVSGSGSYHVWRLGAGPRYCMTPDDSGNHCRTALYGEILLDYASIGNGKVFRFGMDTRLFGNFGFAFDLGIDYPAPGSPQFAFGDGDDGRGAYITFLLRKNWAWHGGHGSARGHVSSVVEGSTGDENGAASGTGQVFADSVIGVSSQYTNDRWSGARALGAPDVFPSSGDDGNAWASQGTDTGDEYIEVGYSNPQRIRGVVVYETFNPGAIRELVLVSSSGVRTAIRVPATSAAPGSRATPFDFACTAEPTAAVRVIIDSKRVAGWNEIDAIGVVPCP